MVAVGECARLKGKTALVTGGAQGIGAALSVRLAEEGCRVAVADIQLEKAKELAGGLPGGLGLYCDVTSLDSCNEALKKTVEAFGSIHILVANAGIVLSGAIDEQDPESWKKVIDVNLIGFYNCCRAAVPYMKKQERGSSTIIQINSKSGKKGSYKNSAYAASKFGGIGLVQSLALELAEYQIRVNAICPGNLMHSPLWTDSLNSQYATNQGMTKEAVYAKYASQVPLGRTCEYEDVAGMMVYLASAEASYITGQAMNVTGGFEMR